jgi:outer membrane protein insertion porin family
MRLILACALALSLAATAAQTRPRKAAPAKPPAAWPIETLTFEGLENYTREQVLEAIGLRPGQNTTGKDLEAAKDRLLATGVFSQVGLRYTPAPDGKGYLVKFELAEAGPFFPIRFEDLGAPDAQLREVLKRTDPFFGPKVPGTETLIARYAKALEGALSGARVAGKLAPDDNLQLSIVFRPAAAPLAVARVRFTGNQVVPSTTLENAINIVAVGVPYREPRMRQLLDNQIRPVYEARSRVRVAFPNIQTEPEKDVKGLVVTVTVSEGESYSLGDVEVQGTGLSPAELKKTASGFKTGDAFNIEAVHAAVGKIDKRLQRDGYMHVKSALDRHIDDKDKKVNLVVHFDRGPQYTFSKLDVQGLDILSEPEIRKMWTLKPGQPFDVDYPDYFLQRIKEEGVFDNLGETKAQLNRDDQDHTVQVTLIFKGQPPKPKKQNP